MEILEQLYEGKAKKVFKTADKDVYMVQYKDDATAFNGAKKGSISDKGIVNNKMSNKIMQQLEQAGIPTHYIEQLSDRETLVKRVKIVPLEVIVRNVTAGSFAKRFGVEEGRQLKNPTLEFCYKNDDLDDPMINNYQITALELATDEELAYYYDAHDLMEGTDRLFAGGRTQMAAVTMGKRGCFLRTRSAHAYCPTYDVEVKDTTGAGDSFIPSFPRPGAVCRKSYSIL